MNDYQLFMYSLFSLCIFGILVGIITIMYLNDIIGIVLIIIGTGSFMYVYFYGYKT